jgi:sugar lactone lactonase YvrE
MCHFNDGRCDLFGRFVVGTVRRSHASERGGCALWRLHGSEITMLDEGFTVCNGIAFNRAADRLYLADSPEGIVYRYPYDPETGAVGARSVFADLPDGFFPDGASVDAEGGYWAALFGSGRIVRLDVEGRVDRVLRAPDKYPTMVAFAGPDLSTMVVTTARRYATIEYLELNPQSGGIFAAQVGAQGIPENLFGWS